MTSTGAASTIMPRSGSTSLKQCGPRPHITLNPYSTQLVDNINMMMGGGGGGNATASTAGGMNPRLLTLTHSLKRGGGGEIINDEEVVYRAVSPHGHVYWEIEPGNRGQHHHPQAAGGGEGSFLLVNSNSQSGSSGNEDSGGSGSRESSHRFNSEQRPLLSSPLSAATMRCQSSVSQAHHGMGDGVSSTFVRTGAGRYNRGNINNNSRKISSPGLDDAGVPEQLQTQVQIRDIKPIHVSVKSSEYIEAKIKTLRNKQS